ncbi:MAG: hypothetical protein WCK77_11410 [Verrucomicrobiota bacterium]
MAAQTTLDRLNTEPMELDFRGVFGRIALREFGNNLALTLPFRTFTDDLLHVRAATHIFKVE